MTRLLFGLSCLACVLAHCVSLAPAAAIYIGPAAGQAAAVNCTGCSRADTVNLLTYITTFGPNDVYTAPVAQQIKITEVNFRADTDGTVTPAVALWNGGNNQLAASYSVLLEGDSIAVTGAGNSLGGPPGVLFNSAFTVGGVNPTISLNAGDMIVASWEQTSNVVFIGSGTRTGPDYIANGLSFPATTPNPPTLNSNWAFTREMKFNIGFDLVAATAIPEPSTFFLAALGLLSLGFVAWRRRRRA